MLILAGWLTALLLRQCSVGVLASAAPAPSVPVPNISFLSASTDSTIDPAHAPRNGAPYVNGTLFDATIPGRDTVEHANKLNDRAVDGMYICQYPHWEGSCFWTEVNNTMYNRCMIITSNGGWASLGPDPGVKVDLYRDIMCQDMFWNSLIYPGDVDAPSRLATTGVAPVNSNQIGAVFRPW